LIKLSKKGRNLKLIIFLVIFTGFIFIGCSSTEETEVTTNSVERNSSETDLNISNGVDTNQSEIDNDNNSGEDTNIDSGVTDIEDELINSGNNEIVMIRNVVYKLVKGDRVFEIDSANIKVIKNVEENFYEVTLLSGRAKIIRK
jgi:hypothetical protein